MQNREQIRLILDWERDNWRLGNVYKNRLAKKPVEVVKSELENLKQSAKDVMINKFNNMYYEYQHYKMTGDLNFPGG